MMKLLRKYYNNAMCNIRDFFDWSDNEIMLLDILFTALVFVAIVTVSYNILF